MVVLVTYKNEEDRIKNELEFRPDPKLSALEHMKTRIMMLWPL